mgnify:CR=1 FL=1
MSGQENDTTPQETRYDSSLPWKKRGLRSKLCMCIAVAWSLYIVLTMCKVFFYLGIIIYPMAHRAICCGALLAVCLLSKPARKGEFSRLPWYDVVLIVWSMAACGYIALHSEQLLSMWSDATPMETVLFLGLYAGGVEAVRRALGAAPAILSLVCFVYFIYSDYAPGFLMSTGFSLPEATGWIFLSGEGFWGSIIGVSTTLIPCFILFGTILQVTGAGDFFSHLSTALMGSYRGGPAKTATLASMLMGTISGSAAANVATTGVITIPLMKQTGYPAHKAAAIEAVASSGGVITPPIMGAVAFMIADFLNIPYWAVCTAAVLPALLFYLTLFYQVDAEAALMGLKGMPRDQLPKAGAALKEGWFYLLPIFMLIFCMGYLRYTAETSILYTIILLLVCTSLSPKSRLTPRRILLVLENTALSLCGIIPMCMIIGVVIASVTVTGSGTGFSGALATLAGNNIFLLLLMAALASFVLGMGMPALGCYLITVTLLGPALIAAGIPPLAAHLYLFYYGNISGITPPVAIATFVASGIADCNPNPAGWQAVVFGLAMYFVPWLFVFKPEIMFAGPAIFILFEFCCALVGLLFLVSGIRGFLFTRIGVPVRIACVLLGTAGIYPFDRPAEAVLLAASALLAAALWLRGKRRPS